MMNKSTILLFCLFLGVSSMSFAQDFEGQIELQSNQKEISKKRFTFKGDWAKMEQQNTQGFITLIKNQKTGQQTLLRDRDGNKIAIIQQAEKQPVKLAHKAPQKRRLNKGDYSLVYTNEVKNIGNYSCKLAIITTEKYEARAWIATGLKLDLEAWFPSLVRDAKAYKKLEDRLAEEGFVVDLNIKDLSTGGEFWRKASINVQNINQQVFKIPQGYRVTDLNNQSQTVQEFKSTAKQLKKLQDSNN